MFGVEFSGVPRIKLIIILIFKFGIMVVHLSELKPDLHDAFYVNPIRTIKVLSIKRNLWKSLENANAI